MIKNKVSIKMIQYEMRNIAGNPFIHIFGLGFPIVLMLVISRSIASELPDPSYLQIATTSIFLGIGSIIPLATILMGYSATASQEIEKGIPLRMELFGFSETYTMLNRLFAELIYMTGAFILYFVIGFLYTDIAIPTAMGLTAYIVSIYILAGILFVMAHGISNIVQKFGPTYLITMLMYFCIMILGGMMGIQTEDLPKVFQSIAKLFPTTFISQDFYLVWTGESYNFVPMIQSYIFLAAVSGILIFVMFYKKRRTIH
ncbi:MAG: ABC transporter permease [Lachnospiraceae bacterium]